MIVTQKFNRFSSCLNKLLLAENKSGFMDNNEGGLMEIQTPAPILMKFLPVQGRF